MPLNWLSLRTSRGRICAWGAAPSVVPPIRSSKNDFPAILNFSILKAKVTYCSAGLTCTVLRCRVSRFFNFFSRYMPRSCFLKLAMQVQLIQEKYLLTWYKNTLNACSIRLRYGDVAQRLAWESQSMGQRVRIQPFFSFYHSSILISAHCAEKRYFNYK